MAFARFSGIAAAIAMMAALGACATTHGGLRSSADRLEHNADALARDSRFESSGYSHDARELAAEAHDFSRTVGDSRADRRDVDSAFAQLSNRYHALRDEVDRTDSRQAQLQFRPVTDAYLDVERAMGGYPSDSRRSSRDRDNDGYRR
jgi:hypothetical protein